MMANLLKIYVVVTCLISQNIQHLWYIHTTKRGKESAVCLILQFMALWRVQLAQFCWHLSLDPETLIAYAVRFSWNNRSFSHFYWLAFWIINCMPTCIIDGRLDAHCAFSQVCSSCTATHWLLSSFVPMMKLSHNTSLGTENLAGCLEMHFLEILIWFHLITLPLRLCAPQ